MGMGAPHLETEEKIDIPSLFILICQKEGDKEQVRNREGSDLVQDNNWKRRTKRAAESLKDKMYNKLLLEIQRRDLQELSQYQID